MSINCKISLISTHKKPQMLNCFTHIFNEPSQLEEWNSETYVETCSWTRALIVTLSFSVRMLEAVSMLRLSFSGKSEVSEEKKFVWIWNWKKASKRACMQAVEEFISKMFLFAKDLLELSCRDAEYKKSIQSSRRNIWESFWKRTEKLLIVHL